jgi:hypothetical protein
MTMPMAQRKQLFEHDDGNETPQQHLDLWWSSHLCDSANMNNILWLKWGNMLGDEIFFSRDQTSHTAKLKCEVEATKKTKRAATFFLPKRRLVQRKKKKIVERINKRMEAHHRGAWLAQQYRLHRPPHLCWRAVQALPTPAKSLATTTSRAPKNTSFFFDTEERKRTRSSR